MTVEDAKKELLVVHRNSPIWREYDHFYSVSSVNRLIEKLVSRINELERDATKKDDAVRLLESILSSICDATISVNKYDTDAGICVKPNFRPSFRYEPNFEFYEDDIKTIKRLQVESGDFDFSLLTDDECNLWNEL